MDQGTLDLIHAVAHLQDRVAALEALLSPDQPKAPLPDPVGPLTGPGAPPVADWVAQARQLLRG